MLELACRMGDTKNAMILLNQILEGFAMFDGNSMAIVRMCNLLQQEVLKTISVRRLNTPYTLCAMPRYAVLQHRCAAVFCRQAVCCAALRLLTAVLRVGRGQDEEHEELLDLAMLVRQSCSPAHMESKRMQEERRMKPIMRDLSVTM